MKAAAAERVRDWVTRTCTLPRSDRELRAQVLEQLRDVIDFAYYVWLLTDPVTWVGTAPLASVPDLESLPLLIRLKYQAAPSRWTALPSGRCVALSAAVTDSPRPGSWQGLLETYGVTDVASLSLRDRYGSWSFLDLWRCGGSPATFTGEETELLSSLAAPLTAALRRSQAAKFSLPGEWPHPSGPAVMVLEDDLLPRQQTPSVDDRLRELLPTAPDLTPVPAAVYNVAAQLLAVEKGIDDHPALARAHLTGGTWISLRASRLSGAQRSGSGSGQIAVTLEAISVRDHVEIFARTTGLSARERQVLHKLVRGSDTAKIAQALHISALTVQDHLKSIFAKTKTNNRYELISRSAGAEQG